MGGKGRVNKMVANEFFKRIYAQGKPKYKRLYEQNRKNTSNLKSYEKIKTLGMGRFSHVHMVKKKGLGSPWFAMKVMDKQHILETQQLDHVINEKRILQACVHPFIVKFKHCFKDKANLFMVTELLQGGELYTRLNAVTKFAADEVRFYTAQIALALEYLHHMEVMHRDLNPENVMIANNGHLRIIDFGFARRLPHKRKAFTHCGMDSYLAPEIISGVGHNYFVDWWAFGVLTYQLATGQLPFSDLNPLLLYDKIAQGRVNYPQDMDPDLKDLLEKVLVVEPLRRLDGMKVRNHQFYKNLSWRQLYEQEMPPPWRPAIKRQDSTDYFLPQETVHWRLSPEERFMAEFTHF